MQHDRYTMIGVVAGLLALILLAGCSAHDVSPQQVAANGAFAEESMKRAGPSASPSSPQAIGMAGPEAKDGKPLTAKLQTVADSRPDRYLIKNSTLRMEVKDPRKALEKVTESVKASRGYLSDMHETVDGLGARSITVTVRIPATGFDQSMLELQSLGKVLERQVTAEDVTEEFVDSQSRLRNLKKTEERLIAHLTRTGKLSDTLLVEKELTRVRQEISRLKGDCDSFPTGSRSPRSRLLCRKRRALWQ
jgi:hypothetical protein